MRYPVVLLLLFTSLAPFAAAQTQVPALAVTLGSDTVYVGDEVEIEVRNQSSGSVRAGLCGSTLQTRARGGEWIDVDTLNCRQPDATAPLAPSGGQLTLRLRPGFGRDLEAGTYRLLVAAIAVTGQPLAPVDRASEPFALLDFASVQPGAMAEYTRLQGWKALAATRRRGRDYVWGYGHGYRTGPEAANRALRECRTRASGEAAGECWLVRLDGPGDAPPER